MTFPATARHALPLLSAGQAQKELAHNEALLIADFMMNPVAEQLGRNDPPATPLEGQAWIVGDAATGAWAGHAGQIACWTPGGWRFLAPFDGLHVWIRDQKLWGVRGQGGWVAGTVAAAKVEIGGQQVVGPRLSAIADPSGGAVVDDPARSAIAAILAALRAHGLISA